MSQNKNCIMICDDVLAMLWKLMKLLKSFYGQLEIKLIVAEKFSFSKNSNNLLF